MSPSRLLLVAHGSRDGAARAAMEAAASGYQRRHPELRVSFAFLELAEPSFADEAKKAAEDPGGALFLPLFLAEGAHTRRDLPGILQALREKNPQAPLRLGRDLGDHPALVELALLRLRETGWDPAQGRALLVAHGARGDGSGEGLARLVRGALQKDPALRLEPCFIGVGEPTLSAKLEAWRPGDAVLGVAPFLLFPGAFLEKIGSAVSAFRARNPSARIFGAPPLGAHELLFQAMDDRLAEILAAP